jgi:hypothetical protein
LWLLFCSSFLPVGAPNLVVKVGAGLYTRLLLPNEHVIMDRTGIVDALATSIQFANKLRNVNLDECKVLVLQHVAGGAPTHAEELAGQELVGSSVINALPGVTHLFIHVSLPSHDPDGTSWRVLHTA